MARAEEGGNQPVRVLLVGGPRHNTYMNFPHGQEEYEFTEDAMLASGKRVPGVGHYVSYYRPLRVGSGALVRTQTNAEVWIHQIVEQRDAHVYPLALKQSEERASERDERAQDAIRDLRDKNAKLEARIQAGESSQAEDRRALSMAYRDKTRIADFASVIQTMLLEIQEAAER